MMKVLCFYGRTHPQEFILTEIPAPDPGPDQILIRVRSAGVTPSELEWKPTWSTRTGDPRPAPIVPGHEFSGEVYALGSNVSGFAPGDQVYGMNNWFINGAQAQFCLAEPDGIALKPKSIDHELAAITPISALTAFQGLFQRASLRSGERVLIHGGAGAVGSFAVQFARMREAHVIATVSEHNLNLVKDLGADEALDYRSADFEKTVNSVDIVFDTVGGETLARSWSVLKPGGRLVTIAASEEDTADPRTRDAFFIVVPNSEQLAEIASLIDAKAIRTIAGKIFSHSHAREAYEEKPRQGKNCLRIAYH